MIVAHSGFTQLFHHILRTLDTGNADIDTRRGETARRPGVAGIRKTEFTRRRIELAAREEAGRRDFSTRGTAAIETFMQIFD
ncbi:MAG: hypothetical protein RIE76_13555, partial [Parvibaculum sp.]